MGKKLIVGLFLSLLLILSACSSSSNGTEKTSSGDEKKEENISSTGETFNFRVAHTYPQGDFISKGVENWAERIKERTDGNVNIEVFPAGQLGGEKDLIEALQVGTLDFATTAFSGTDLFDNFFLPFVFRDADHMWKVMRGPIGEEFNEKYYEMTGIKVLGYAYRSPRLLTSNKEIQSPEDVVGMKIRVPEMPQYISTWEALGASPTPMAFPEVFYGLQQGVIDGQENPAELIHSSSFHEVQDYLILTNHVRSFFQSFVNGKVWDTIPSDYQEIIIQTWDEVADEVQIEVEAATDEIIKELEEKGMTIIEVNEDEWREKTKDVWQQFTPQSWGEGMYEEIQVVN